MKKKRIITVNGLNRLTELTTSKGQARPIRFEYFRIGQSRSNRIESRTFDRALPLHLPAAMGN